MKYICFMVAAVVFALACSDYADSSTLRLNGELIYEHILNSPRKGWDVEDHEDNLTKVFTATDSAKPKWRDSGGAILKLDLMGSPAPNLHTTVGVNFIMNYADRFWQPVNDYHRLDDAGAAFRLRKADIQYRADFATFRYFRGVGLYHWRREGDVFGLFPEQMMPERYLRISGDAAPEGFGVESKTSYGDFKVIAGPEVVWGYRNSGFFKYDNNIRGTNVTLIHKNVEIPYGYTDENERLHETAVSARFRVNHTPVQLGLKYRPFRIGEDYQYVEEVSKGKGVRGSKYKLKTGETEFTDALGFKGVVNLNPYPVVEYLRLSYTHERISAGNKNEVSASATRRFTHYLDGGLELTYRKPLIGPLPLIYEGTKDNPGAPVISPRGPFDPFWVSWQSYEWENREAQIATLTLTFDPGRDAWFYRYEPNIVELWNINEVQDAEFACAASYSLKKYPAATDRLYFHDEDGKVEWDPFYTSGAWGSEKLFHDFKFIGKLRLPGTRLTLDVNAGKLPAHGGLGYIVDGAKPVTAFYKGDFIVTRGPYDLTLTYGRNVWGPEELDWHRTFGVTLDHMFRVGFERLIGDNALVGAKYTAVREEDMDYNFPEFGSFDEIMVYAGLRFSSLIRLD